jgi:fermentation-respiration switch protein FrsA (DUF1100 family)
MLFWIIIVPVGAYVIMALVLFINQRRLAFIPAERHDMTPDDAGLTYENTFIHVGNGARMHGWYFPVPGSRQVVMLCHGNAGNISHRIETAEFLTSLGVNAFLFDYRGYGRSDGSATEQNTYADARAVYEWLRSEKNFSPQAIFIFGRSLGGAVAVELATQVNCGGLIVESSFTSAAALGKRMFPYMPIDLLLRIRYDSLARINSINCPLLVTHSPQDEVIPFEMGKALFDAANEPKQFVSLAGGHNDREYLRRQEYVQAWHSILSPPKNNDLDK